MKTKIFLLIICFCFITGCGNYHELNDLAIITGVAIDKSGDEYELSLLIANSPKTQSSNKEGESTTTVFSGKGKTLVEAVTVIGEKTPKQLYYGHINVVIISEQIAREGFLNIADWLLRNPETRKQYYILQSKDTKAKNILKISEPLESFPSKSIASLIESNIIDKSMSSNIKYSPFIEKILDKGYDPILPGISIKGEVKKGSNEKNLEKTTPDTYIKLDDTAIFRGDKFVGYINQRETQDVNVINGNVVEARYLFKYKNSNISFISNKIDTKTTIENMQNIKIKVTGYGYLSEINGDVDIQKPSTIHELENKLEKTMKKRLQKTIRKLQTEYKSDIFGFGNKIYVKYPKKWEKIENEWNDKYFPKLNIDIDTKITIESTGSLIRTIEEVKSKEVKS